DFGKIGVREEVLLKAKKLFPSQLEGIRARFELATRGAEVDVLSRKVRLLERAAKEAAGAPGAAALAADLAALDEDLLRRKRDLDAAFGLILAANEPTVLKGGDFARIEALARETYADLEGNLLPLLQAAEVTSLSVARGSLTPGEFDEIRSHVS